MTLAVLAGAPAAGAAQDRPIPLERAIAYFVEAQEISAGDGGRLWGTVLYGPMLFVHPATRFAVANVPDSAGVLSLVDGVYAGTLPREMPVANTALEWGGRRWTMVLWPPPADGTERRRLLAHELFHRVQAALGLPMSDPPSPHLASAPGRTWMRLEWRALARALGADGAERARAVADALAFRAHRRALFPDAAAAERALELSEGLAEYTGARLSGVPDAALRAGLVERLAAAESHESLVRSFAYASVPAYGVLLDAAGAKWRRAITAETDLGQLLARAFALRPPGGESAERRAGAYGGAEVTREEAERAKATAARRAELRSRFVEGPRLVLPMAGNVSFSFDPGDAAVIDGAGTVYETAEVGAGWGVLKVEGGGVLFLQDRDGFTGIVLPVPAAADAPPTTGPGWSLELAAGWRIQPAERAGEWRAVRTGP